MSILTIDNGSLLPLGIISALSTSSTKVVTASGDPLDFYNSAVLLYFSFLIGVLLSNELQAIVCMILFASLATYCSLICYYCNSKKNFIL